MKDEQLTNHLEKLYAKSKELFRDTDGFNEWLHRPSIDLQGKKPIEQIHSQKGIEELFKILNRIEHGILS